ncbi:hypothetical protein ABN254_21430, partial [Providencia rettgeri]
CDKNEEDVDTIVTCVKVLWFLKKISSIGLVRVKTDEFSVKNNLNKINSETTNLSQSKASN